jgi:hypothetical protein
MYVMKIMPSTATVKSLGFADTQEKAAIYKHPCSVPLSNPWVMTNIFLLTYTAKFTLHSLAPEEATILLGRLPHRSLPHHVYQRQKIIQTKQRAASR